MTTDYFRPTPDASGLLDAILENPKDMAPRTIYADAIEESGNDIFAKFIRTQCAKSSRYIIYGRKDLFGGRWAWCCLKHTMPNFFHWKKVGARVGNSILPRDPLEFSGYSCQVNGGLVGNITMRAEDFFGECKKCLEHNKRGPILRWSCDDCGGKRNYETVKRVFSTHPITSVNLRDIGIRFRDTWFRQPRARNYWDRRVGEIPTEIFSHLPCVGNNETSYEHNYPMMALSHACVNFGRSLVGLPILKLYSDDFYKRK